MKKFYYGKNVISSEEIPNCNICGEKIKIELKRGKYKITGCSNKHCEAYNTKKHKILLHMIFGEKYVNEYVSNFKKTRILNKEYWINKGFTEEESILKIKEIQAERSSKVQNRGRCDKETIIKKIGAENAELFFKEKSRYCIEYWLKRGYNEEQALNEISKLQSDNSLKQDFSQKCFQSPRCKEYWMIKSGMTEKEAIQQVSDYQKTFTKEKCIKKYGLEEGLKIWKNRQDKWQESLHKSHNLHVGYSKVSQKLFNEILNLYEEDKIDYVFYGSKNREYSIRKNNINYIYDFTDLEKRKIIEFQGDIYHGNPEFFKENDYPNPYHKNKTAKNLWDYDKLKKEIANEENFDVLTIWENDYRKNKKEVLENCIKFLNL